MPNKLIDDETHAKFAKLIAREDRRYCFLCISLQDKSDFISKFGEPSPILHLADTDLQGCDKCGYQRDVIYMPIARFILQNSAEINPEAWLSENFPRTRSSFLAFFNGDIKWRDIHCDEQDLLRKNKKCNIKPIFTEKDKKNITILDRIAGFFNNL